MEDLTEAIIVLGCIIINDGIQPNILVQRRSTYIQILRCIGLTGYSMHQIFVVPVEKVREIVNCCMRSALFTSFHEISLICNKQILDK